VLTGQRSTVKGVHGSTGPTGQPHPEAGRWAPRVRPGKEKGKGSDWFWAQRSWAGSFGPTGSAWLVGSARLAAQQAGSGRWAGCVRGPDSIMGHYWAGGLLPFAFSSCLAGLLLLLPLLADKSAPCVSLGGIQCGGARIRCGKWACVCACQSVCVWRPKGARGKASKA
jgi:hypothetical protein